MWLPCGIACHVVVNWFVMLCYAVEWSVLVCCVVLWCVILYCVALDMCCVVLCCVMSYCVDRWCIASHSIVLLWSVCSYVAVICCWGIALHGMVFH